MRRARRRAATPGRWPALRDAHPLQLAAGHDTDRDRGQCHRVDLGQARSTASRRCLRAAGRSGASPQRWPSTPSRTAIRAAQAQTAVHGAVLGDVSDPVASWANRLSLDQRGARRADLTEEHLDQGRLSGSVGAEDRDELSGRHAQVEVVPQHPLTEGQPGSGDRDDLGGRPPGRAQVRRPVGRSVRLATSGNQFPRQGLDGDDGYPCPIGRFQDLVGGAGAGLVVEHQGRDLPAGDPGRASPRCRPAPGRCPVRRRW